MAPILTYGSEIWAPYFDHDCKSWDQTPIEKCHSQFLKRVLGVNRSTTNVMVRSELGRHSLQERITKRNLKYIQYVAGKDAHSLVWHALNYELTQIDHRKTIFSLFQRHEKELFSSCLTDPQVSCEGHATLVEKVKSIEEDKLHSSVKNCFDSLWKNELTSFPKADSFRKFKQNVKFEKYLEDIRIRKHRVSLTKLRLSDHCLMIERGRYSRPIVPREERFCPHCPMKLEDEEHFLTQCSAYDRTSLYSQLTDACPQFGHLDHHNKFIFLLSQEDNLITKELAREAHKWLTVRLEFETLQKELEQAMSTF